MQNEMRLISSAIKIVSKRLLFDMPYTGGDLTYAVHTKIWQEQKI